MPFICSLGESHECNSQMKELEHFLNSVKGVHGVN